MSASKTSNVETDNISFQEFRELCQEAGISTDNLEVLEQDFRAGRALADVTDELITDYEVHPKAYTSDEALDLMEVQGAMLEEAETLEGKRKAAIKMAVSAIRYLAECCHDEGKN